MRAGLILTSCFTTPGDNPARGGSATTRSGLSLNFSRKSSTSIARASIAPR